MGAQLEKGMYNGFWIPESARQAVITALVLSKHHENHICSHGNKIYVNGEFVADVGDTEGGVTKRLSDQISTKMGIANLEYPFTDIWRASDTFEERLKNKPYDYKRKY